MTYLFSFVRTNRDILTRLKYETLHFPAPAREGVRARFVQEFVQELLCARAVATTTLQLLQPQAQQQQQQQQQKQSHSLRFNYYF